MRIQNLVFYSMIFLFLASCAENRDIESTQTSSGDESTEISNKISINNPHEWDTLKEAVVGRWVINTFRTPSIDMGMKEQFPYIPEAAWTYLKKSENQLLSDVYKEDDLLYHEEQENLVRIMEENGVVVRRPDEIEFPIIATSQCYSRDPIIAIGDKFIITNMNLRVEDRRPEITAELLWILPQNTMVK